MTPELAYAGELKHIMPMFFEYIPHMLSQWVGERIEDPATVRMLFRDAFNTFDLMRTRGLTHFDAHWENIQTDGQQLYFTDMGLAQCNRFDLADDERSFLREHESTYDYALFARGLCGVIRWMPGGSDELVARMFGAPNAAVEAQRHGVPLALACLIEQFGHLALLMLMFIRAVTKDKATPYPRRELERALEKARELDRGARKSEG